MATFGEMYQQMDERLARHSGMPLSSPRNHRPAYLAFGHEARTRDVRLPIGKTHMAVARAACSIVRPDWTYTPDPLFGDGDYNLLDLDKRGIILEQRVFNVGGSHIGFVRPIRMMSWLTMERAAELDASGENLEIPIINHNGEPVEADEQSETVLAALSEFQMKCGDEATKPLELLVHRDEVTPAHLEAYAAWIDTEGY
jgi:hypothetical protein